MTDDFRRLLQGEVGIDEPAPVEEIMAKGTALRRQRRRHRTAAVAAGLVVLALLAVLTLEQVRRGDVSVHVVGTPGQDSFAGVTPSSTSSASVLTATEQREVAVSAAILRYEIGQLTPTGTAASPSPSDATSFVQNQFFALAPTATAADPNRYTTRTQVGPVPTSVQGGIVNALAPTPIVFVPNDHAVTVPLPSAPGCVSVAGSGYVFRLGSVPSAGDQIQVYAGWDQPAWIAGGEAVYALARTGNSWTVTGTVGPEEHSLGGCG